MKKNQQGQALIELIIFLPLMFMVYSLIGGFANAINGSINQQKVTRAYFYYLAQNNSTIPSPDRAGRPHEGWSRFGMTFVGWRERFASGESPLSPCYKVNVPLKANQNDKCEESYSEPASLFIRVGTVYGLCGASYINESGTVMWLPHSRNANYTSVVDLGSCTIE